MLLLAFIEVLAHDCNSFGTKTSSGAQKWLPGQELCQVWMFCGIMVALGYWEGIKMCSCDKLEASSPDIIVGIRHWWAAENPQMGKAPEALVTMVPFNQSTKKTFHTCSYLATILHWMNYFQPKVLGQLAFLNYAQNVKSVTPPSFMKKLLISHHKGSRSRLWGGWKSGQEPGYHHQLPFLDHLQKFIVITNSYFLISFLNFFITLFLLILK